MAAKKQSYTAKLTDYPRQEIEVDKDTGEVIKMTETISTRTIEVPILEDYVDVKLPRKFKFNNGGFITIFQKAMAISFLLKTYHSKCQKVQSWVSLVQTVLVKQLY